MADDTEFVTREKRNPNKKTNWGKPDKLNHQKKVAAKRMRDEDSDEDDWRQYETR
jgi:hypothetical protein